jgi:hypothetical protein
MPDKLQGLTWWYAVVPLCGVSLVVGLLVLEAHTFLSPRAHQLAWFGMAVLLEGVVLYCLWCARAVQVRAEAAQRAQTQERSLQRRQPPGAWPRSNDTPWEDAWWEAQGNGHRREP